jgi:nucleoside-diphosphate-sugar epimerase
MRSEKIYVAGHRGMFGSVIVRALQKRAESTSKCLMANITDKGVKIIENVSNNNNRKLCNTNA